MGVLALVWVLIIAIQLAGLAPPQWEPVLRGVDIAIWALFLVQFVLELWIAPDKRRYLRGNWIVALSVLVPLFGFLRLLLVLRALPSLRLLNILAGTGRATRGAFNIVREHGLQYVALIAAITVLVGSASVYYFERAQPASALGAYPQALWWASALITTINTSTDPVTLEGSIIAFIMRVIALSIFGYITASIASFLVGGTAPASPALGDPPDPLLREIQDLRREVQQLSTRLDRLEPPE